MVTCMAVHPTGHFFAVGYTDGSIAFWAVDDDTKPLVTRTLDDDDVDIVDQDFLQGSHGFRQKFSDRSGFGRQPVYKLSWSGFPNSSDPRGGETILTVLGGLVTSKPTTTTIVAFPPFNPPAPPVDGTLYHRINYIQNSAELCINQ
jgi:syntaxin-binding protein 5